MPGSVIADDVLALPHPLLLVPRTEGKPKKISHAPKALQNANPIEKDKSRTPSPHAYVGVSLVLGFLLMYLIDKIPQHTSSESHVHRRPYHISLEHLPEGLARVDPTDGEPEAGESAGELPLASHASRGASTTIGLVIHAAADGIALGASSSTADTNLGLVVFLAIMVHKAPAAFGLTSVLLKQGLSRRRARAHLVVFSLAAPVGALATWILVNAAGRSQLGGGHDEQQTRWWTGILLLFSGGTFLYVTLGPACHSIVPELSRHPILSLLFSPPYADEPRANKSPAMWRCTRCKKTRADSHMIVSSIYALPTVTSAVTVVVGVTVTSSRHWSVKVLVGGTLWPRSSACSFHCSLEQVTTTDGTLATQQMRLIPLDVTPWMMLWMKHLFYILV